MRSASPAAAGPLHPTSWRSSIIFIALLGVSAAGWAWSPRPSGSVALPASGCEVLSSGGPGEAGERGVLAHTPTRSVAILLALGGGIFVLVRSSEAREAARRLERLVWERTEELRRANERLAALAMTDELTGVANRRRLMDALREGIAFARRHDAPLSILLADLDGFKEVNDRLGHAMGDEVLRWAARALERELRTEDLIGRYGGDEFVVILPGTDLASAQVAGERLRRAVLGLDDSLAAAGLPGALTVSVGVAAFPGDLTEASELVARADAAVYRVKAQGKNRVSD